MLAREDFSGKKYGMLTVLKYFNSINGVSLWECLCDCGETKIVRSSDLKFGSTKSCGCFRRMRCFTGYKEISGSYWKSIIYRAKKQNHNFNLNIKDLYLVLERQNYKCPYTGRLLKLGTIHKSNYDGNFSIDRVNSDFGYSLENCDLVYKPINTMKWHFSKELFISYCFAVANPSFYKKNVLITKTMFSIWNSHWKKHKLDFNLDKEYLQDLLNKQNGTCFFTGLPLYIQNKTRKISFNSTASVDRINNNFGHIKGNVRFVHKNINIMKLDYTDEEFYSICKEISNYCCINKNG